jgi:cytochrome c-type biogenesis protein CcmF
MVEVGYFSLIFALMFTGYSGLSSILGVREQRKELVASSENGVLAVWGLLSVASAALIYALVSRDFQIEYVAKYTNRTLPLVYTLTAFYAGQEGSLLLWAWLLSLFCFPSFPPSSFCKIGEKTGILSPMLRWF